MSITAGLALLVLVGAMIGTTVLAGVTGPILNGVLAFGVAALLYLATEELLVEAHEVPETSIVTEHPAETQDKRDDVAVQLKTAAQRFTQAVWGPLAGLVVNIVLVVIKVIAGLASGSVALLADAGHSGADIANNVFVLASLFYARRGADETHPYGHDRAEVLAAMASVFILTGAGLFFGWDSIQKIIVGTPEPSLLALWVAIGTLVIKLVVAWVELRIGNVVHSQAVQADAHDNLADVLSSVAVIVGVIAAQFGNPRMDGIAGLVIAVLILFNALQIGRKASHELLDHNLDAKTILAVREAANRVGGVSVVAATGREHGSDVLVELSIEVDPRLSVAQGAELAEAVRYGVSAEVPSVGDVAVELNTNHVRRLREHLR